MNKKQKILNQLVGALDQDKPIGEALPNIPGYLDSTMLSPTTTASDVTELCEQAANYNFRSVRVPPNMVAHATTVLRKVLKNETVLVGTVISFPYGYDSPKAKAGLITQALIDGADEADVVLSHDLKMSGLVYQELIEYQSLAQLITIMPIIQVSHFDSCINLLEGTCRIIQGIDFIKYIKTSTGAIVRGTTVDDVSRLKHINGDRFKIKASGGIKTWDDAKKMVKYGADIIGTSNAVDIALGYLSEQKELEKRMAKPTPPVEINLKNTTLQ